jgi:hypothetical protein
MTNKSWKVARLSRQPFQTAIKSAEPLQVLLITSRQTLVATLAQIGVAHFATLTLYPGQLF